ncbi:hypothetical protein [Lactobacillus phage Semele]|uniref:Uncharacterized protein n=1 Tax=Lactobacillus phage Semele TaxID=2079433 RepID=A0A2K9VD50_9CAUD|nr:hypothetical protein HOS80_gp116 [Lactobacillus phage Semele]AUV60142.1 hypothetical protein [Lactobacillus phage Semele]
MYTIVIQVKERGNYIMLIINMETLPKIIELALAIYGGVKLVDKLFPGIKQSKFFKSFFN